MTSLAFEIVTIAVALLAAGFAWRLDRRLSAMRKGQDGMTKMVSELAEATLRAEQAVAALKREGAETGQALETAIRDARSAADELRLLQPSRRIQSQAPRKPAASESFNDIFETTR